jgi:hypothetical protein
MSETMLKQKQQMLDDALRLIDEQMAHFAGLSAAERAIESEMWFRREIAKQLAPIVARIVQLETKPAPTPIAAKPSKAFIGAIGQLIHDETKALRERIEALERKIDALEMKQGQFRYCGTWSADAIYFEGNFVTEGGSLWHANRQTTQRPGDGSDLQLCVKRGKDGKDADNVRRLPTAQRA